MLENDPDIDGLLAKIASPDFLPHALQLVREYRLSLQELMDRAKRVEAEKLAYLTRWNVMCGEPPEGAAKIAENEIAFFRSQLAEELDSTSRKLKEELARQLEFLQDDSVHL